MLSLQGAATRLCDGFTRREALRIGGLGAIGLSLPRLLAARAASPAAGGNGFGRAKACIVLWMAGGPSQHETWDPKPEAPPEIRGPFGSAATSVPGLRVGELMPRTAALCHRLCVVRSMVTNNPGHAGGTYEMLTGMEHPGGKGNENIKTSRTDFPYFGSVVKRFRPPVAGVPTTVVYPEYVAKVPEWPGQHGGFLGSPCDPWHIVFDPTARDFTLDDLTLRAEVPVERLSGRRSLLDRLGDHFDRLQRGPAPSQFGGHLEQAFDLLAGQRVRAAFDLRREAPALRDHYGRNPFGQGCLLARRLVEAGVSLVQVNWHRPTGADGPEWDTHVGLEKTMKHALMPAMDQGYPALLEDMDRRGLLGETLVMWMGEMGRTPKLEYVPGKENEGIGRNHWGGVFSIALAGAGVRGGLVHGASDKHGAYPKDDPVTPADLTATLFHGLGIAPDTEIRDRLHRPHPISRGRVLYPWFG
jgi:hypothetical protein